MVKNKCKMVIIVLTITLIIFTSGCFERSRTLESIIMRMPLDYNEVKNINISHVTNELQKIGYNVKFNPPQTTHDYEWIIKENDSLIVYIFGDRNATYSVGDFVTNAVLDIELNNATDETKGKEYIKEKAIEIGTICNLTLQWDKCEWGVNYAN